MSVAPITVVTSAASALGNLILVTPQNTVGYQPQNQVGQPYNQPAIMFHYEGEQTASFESDITDHYIENNTTIQDQIALPPVVITTQGFIGELNNVPPNKALAIAQIAAQKLTGVSAYAPALSTTALLAYNEAVFAYATATNLANNAVAAWSSVTGSGGESVVTGNGLLSTQPNQTQQQKYFQLFYGYWYNRTLFTIQTPWAIFENMAIKSLKAIQGADTAVITDFEITFKQLRFASALDASGPINLNPPPDPSDTQSLKASQGLSNPTTNLGTSALTTSPTSNAGVISRIAQ